MANANDPHPAVAELLEKLDDIVAAGPHEADPRVPAVRVAEALAAYFRTPD